MAHLFMFYGTECPHCERMEVLIKKLEEEKKVKVERLEVWHDKDNEKMMEGYDKNRCGGVPFFYNTKTDKWICGEENYNSLITWAKD